MKSQRNLFRKRIPKPGCFHQGLLVLGYLSIAAGGLITLGGMIGFVSIFMKSASDIPQRFKTWTRALPCSRSP